MRGVPPFGFPNRIKVTGSIARPTVAASACWSMVAKILIPRDWRAEVNRETVAEKESGLLRV
jgi:hypothetical protein